jgi:hypothetical protein
MRMVVAVAGRCYGALQEITKNAVDYYELGRPQSFFVPMHVDPSYFGRSVESAA